MSERRVTVDLARLDDLLEAIDRQGPGSELARLRTDLELSIRPLDVINVITSNHEQPTLVPVARRCPRCGYR